MIGIVENLQRGHGFVRALDGWARFFMAGADCVDGTLPELHATVEFEPDLSDGRGQRARRVRMIADPAAPIERVCRDCGEAFSLDAGVQAWYACKGLQYPSRCLSCRDARRA